MNDFKRATGILSKARQASMFEKPAKVLERTQSGKPVYDHTQTPETFKEQHKDWSIDDHTDAARIHHAVANVHLKFMLSRKRGEKKAADQDYATYFRHYGIGDQHKNAARDKHALRYGVL